jgi:hypothetical protein
MSDDRCLPDRIERVLSAFSVAVDQSVVARTDDETVPQLVECFECLEEHLFNLTSALQLYDAIETMVASYEVRLG